MRLLLRACFGCVPLLLVFACEDSTNTTPGAPDSGKADVSLPDSSTADNYVPPIDSSTPIDSGSDVVDTGATFTTILPFATGLGTNGTTLADGQIDPHWTVKDANNVVLTSYVQTDAQGYIGYWMQPTVKSKFISPFVDTVDPTGQGVFTYTTTFTLKTGINLSGVSLVIKYCSDNTMNAVKVNGTSINGVVAGSYSTYETVNVTTGFVVGTNTVELTVGNSGGPTGMRAELELTAP